VVPLPHIIGVVDGVIDGVLVCVGVGVGVKLPNVGVGVGVGQLGHSLFEHPFETVIPGSKGESLYDGGDVGKGDGVLITK
jgi:hypothetical protein